ncbi:MAG TPA: hypothetical protein VFY49_11595 [Myxococcota bacterium]|nr:hypothetical protein [Myxococcota bacterium]
MTRALALVALLLLAVSAGCGKYGKPRRITPTPPTVAVPAPPGAATPAPAPAATPAPAGEECEDDEKQAEPAP